MMMMDEKRKCELRILRGAVNNASVCAIRVRNIELRQYSKLVVIYAMH